MPVIGDSPLAPSATERNWVYPTRCYTFSENFALEAQNLPWNSPQAGEHRSLGRHDPGLHEAVRIGLAAILGDGEQYVQDICVVGLVERRCLSGDAATPQRSPPFQKVKLWRQRTGSSTPKCDGNRRWTEKEDEREHIGAAAAAFITFARILQI